MAFNHGYTYSDRIFHTETDSEMKWLAQGPSAGSARAEFTARSNSGKCQGFRPCLVPVCTVWWRTKVGRSGWYAGLGQWEIYLHWGSFTWSLREGISIQGRVWGGLSRGKDWIGPVPLGNDEYLPVYITILCVFLFPKDPWQRVPLKRILNSFEKNVSIRTKANARG